MFLFSRVVLLCLILSSCATGSRQEYRASLFLEIGEEQLSRGELPGALQNLTEANRLDPENPRILNGLGLVYFLQNQFDYSIEYFKNALALNSQFTEVHNNLGRVYLTVGQYEESEKHLNLASKDLTYPFPEKILSNLGLLYQRKKNYPKSKDFYLEAIKKNREFCPAYSQYGQTLLLMKDYEGASLIFDRAVRICITQPEEVHYLSGLSHYHSGRKDRAIARFEEVVKLYPASEYADKARSLLNVMRQDKK